MWMLSVFAQANYYMWIINIERNWFGSFLIVYVVQAPNLN